MSDSTNPAFISLFFRDAGSDKQYDISLEEVGGGWVVNFANGRRGGTLRSGTKTQSPVSYPEARKIFDKLLREKMSKGYTAGESGTPFEMSDKAGRISGFNCQLLNTIVEDDVDSLIESDRWVAQQKFDGERRAVRKNGDEIVGINRKGLIVSLTKGLHDECKAIDRSFLIDGEQVGDHLHVFDILELDGVDLRNHPYEHRLLHLDELMSVAPNAMYLHPVLTAATVHWKKSLYDQLRSENAEGIVFKHKGAPYSPGRPNSGGSQLKFKFYDTASVIVSRINDKRSVAVEVLDGNKRVPVGNVTIPANFNIPDAGSIVEVRYLYAYEGGSLYQPVYLGERNDIDLSDCNMTQIKFRQEIPAPAGFSF